MTERIMRPRVQAVQVWQYDPGEIVALWPHWVRQNVLFHGGELVHERRSGRQIVNPGEYLVKDLDGGVNYYTEDELRREYA